MSQLHHADGWVRTIFNFESPYRLRELLPPFAEDHSAGVSQDQKFKIRIASSDVRRHSASMLIQKMYERRGYYLPMLKGDPYRITVLVYQDERVVGTTTLGLDSTQGLLADEVYGAELDELRKQGRKICELTKLAIDDANVDSRHIIAVLFHLCKIYGQNIHGASDCVIEINPRHSLFYQRLLGFAPFGPERLCKRVNAPAVLLRLTMDYADQQIRSHGGKFAAAKQVKSLYPYCFSKEDEIGITGRLMRGE